MLRIGNITTPQLSTMTNDIKNSESLIKELAVRRYIEHCSVLFYVSYHHAQLNTQG